MLVSKKIIALLSVASLCVSAQSFAEDTSEEKSETSVKVEDIKKDEKEGVDSEITNKKMRAQLGSKSKYSMSTEMSYSGGSISKPFDSERLNLSGKGAPVFVKMSGSVSGRYRIDKRQSVSLSTGVTVVQPFHASDSELDHENYLDKTKVSNPGVSYSYATKMMGLQMVNGAGATLYTSDSAKRINSVGGVYVSNTILGSIGKAGNFQVGLASYLSGDFFSGNKFKGNSVRERQYDYAVQFFPFAEYVLNDTFNLRTVFQQLQYFHNVDAPGSGAFEVVNGAQSLGLGISVSRNVFLYPNFQFSTENLSSKWISDNFAKTSTVGINATVNMF